jgi:hypothetical protein
MNDERCFVRARLRCSHGWLGEMATDVSNHRQHTDRPDYFAEVESESVGDNFEQVEGIDECPEAENKHA